MHRANHLAAPLPLSKSRWEPLAPRRARLQAPPWLWFSRGLRGKEGARR